jgi:type I restriction enzyme S subunit
VPDSWSVLRVKEVATVLPSNIDKLTIDGEQPVLLCNYVDVYKNDKITTDIEFMRATATDEQIRKLSLVKGDVVLTKDSESPWDIAVPTYIAEDIPSLVCGYHLAKLAPNVSLMRGDFLFWALKSFPVSVHFSLAASGITRYGLSIANISDGNTPVPSLTEQQDIASYLDRETARIDMLIAEKGRLIETLREYRQATISEVVTQGLDLAAPKKHSGVPWLGEVPAHWEVQRLRFRCKLNPGVRAGLKDSDVASFLPMEAVDEDGSLNLEATRPVGEVSSGYTYFEDGDVTIAKITPCFENGKGAVMRGLQGGIGFGTTELIVVRPNNTVHPEWLYYLTKSESFHKRGEAMMYGAGGQKRVPESYVKDLPVAWPPIEEQVAIADYLACETIRIDKLIEHVQDEIKLLQELRAATITDAVTGKIQVW